MNVNLDLKCEEMYSIHSQECRKSLLCIYIHTRSQAPSQENSAGHPQAKDFYLSSTTEQRICSSTHVRMEKGMTVETTKSIQI